MGSLDGAVAMVLVCCYCALEVVWLLCLLGDLVDSMVADGWKKVGA